MSVNEEFLDEVLQDVVALGTDHSNDPPAPQSIEEAKKAILQHFQQEQEKGSIKEIADTLNGSGSHACYCPRSVDGGCKCALKDEYLVPYAEVDGKKPYYTQSEVDRLIREARIDELRSIDYGCDEDVEENDVILKKILDEAKSTIDGRSLRNRVEWLSKQKDSNKSG